MVTPPTAHATMAQRAVDAANRLSVVVAVPEAARQKVAASAAIGSASAFALAWAYGRAEAQLLSMVEYTAFIWAAILGYVVFSEQVSGYTVAGAGLIIIGCLVAVRGSIAPAPQTEAAA